MTRLPDFYWVEVIPEKRVKTLPHGVFGMRLWEAIFRLVCRAVSIPVAFFLKKEGPANRPHRCNHLRHIALL